MAKVETTRNDDGSKVTGIFINGKAVMKSYLNAFLKAQELPYFRLSKALGVCTVTNLFGSSFDLDPLEKAVFDFVQAWERRYNSGGVKAAGAPISTFDNMRYLFLAMNSDAYMALLD